MGTISGNAGAFAAVKEDGRIITWGGARFGGDMRKLPEGLLKARVSAVVGTSCSGNNGAFAALIDSGETANVSRLPHTLLQAKKGVDAQAVNLSRGKLDGYSQVATVPAVRIDTRHGSQGGIQSLES